MNKEALRYYGITESSYRDLSDPKTDFMNLGFWPADSLIEAQKRLVEVTVQQGIRHLSHVIRGLHSNQRIANSPEESNTRVLELGSGWGGSLPVLLNCLPNANYTGLNLSSKQVEHSRAQLAAQDPEIQYHVGYFEDFSKLDFGKFDLVYAIEAMLHAMEKSKLIRILADRCSSFSFAEITIEDKTILESEPLFYPALTHCFSSSEYESCLKNVARGFECLDLTEQVFLGWSTYLEGLDPKIFKGNRKVLNQFRLSYQKIAQYAEKGLIRYLILSGEFKK